MVRALETNRTETYVGGVSRWISRVNRYFPRLVDWLLARRVRQLYLKKPAPGSSTTPSPIPVAASAPAEDPAQQNGR